MRAVILAAGRGSRMKDLTDDQPKCLVELNSKTLLERQLEALKRAGLQDIAIVTGYKRELLKDRGTLEFHNSRWAETNMVSSLAMADEWLTEGPCIVSYSDIFYGSEAVKSLMESSADLAVTYDPNWLDIWGKRFDDPLDDAETFRLTPDHTLAEIGAEPKSIDEVEGQYMGLLRFTPAGWAELKRVRENLPSSAQDKMHMTGTLQRIIESGRTKVHAIPYIGEWGEVDSQADVSTYTSSGVE